MPHKRLVFAVIVLMLGFVLYPSAPSAHAQENLLRDPGFEYEGTWKRVAEGTDAADGNTYFNVPPDWNGWYTTQPRNDNWQNRLPNGYPHSGTGFVRSGNRSANLDRGSATFTAAIYQTVSVPEGANVIGGAWVRMNMDLDAGSSSQARVGIHPSGGTNPYDGAVVWSNWVVNSVHGFTQMSVNATATGTAVTIFLFATQNLPSDPNGVYWDDASLVIGGGGGTAPGQPSEPGEPVATPVPPPPPSASFVQAQPPQEDGSIVHTVQSGDTMFAIAVAYGVPASTIQELNNISDARILQVGQRLIIRPDGSSTGAPTPSDDGDEVDEPSETDDPVPVDPADEEEIPEVTESSTTGTSWWRQGQTTTEGPDNGSQAVLPTPAATLTPAPPAPVAQANTDTILDPAAQVSSVCVMMFEDTNLNRVMEPSDPLLAGGTITLVRNGANVEAIVTDSSPEPYCFEELEAGDYTAIATAPTGYGLTTPDQLRLRVQAGTTLTVNFGAAQGVEAVAPPPADVTDITEEVTEAPEDDDGNPLMQNIGLIVFALAGLTLVGGLGATLLLRRG